MTRETEGLIFDIDTFAVHDGPGIRMAVYLKGCPLRCKWCHSPESQGSSPQVIFVADRCSCCGACAHVCRQEVHELHDGTHSLAMDKCVVCGACVAECVREALSIKGRRVTASEVAARAVRMKGFFKHSGGGVTLTGGEVTGQAEFALDVLERCRNEGIHTAVETAGVCDWKVLEAIADVSDLVLYDLKLIDDEEHRRWTGASNASVLENARRLAGRNVEVRVPLVPGITDTDENLLGIFEFMKEAGLERAAVLPYNESTPAKYEWLGTACEISGDVQSQERLEEIIAMALEAGVKAAVG